MTDTRAKLEAEERERKEEEAKARAKREAELADMGKRLHAAEQRQPKLNKQVISAFHNMHQLNAFRLVVTQDPNGRWFSHDEQPELVKLIKERWAATPSGKRSGRSPEALTAKFIENTLNHIAETRRREVTKEQEKEKHVDDKLDDKLKKALKAQNRAAALLLEAAELMSDGAYTPPNLDSELKRFQSILKAGVDYVRDATGVKPGSKAIDL